MFSAVNQSQSTSLLYCRCLTNQNIQNTNLLEHKVFKSTSLSLHPYSTDDTCSKSKLHSFHSLGNFSNCYCFVAFPHFPHASQVPSDPVLSQHHTLQVRREPGTTAGSIQFTAADELSESIFHLHTLTLSIPIPLRSFAPFTVPQKIAIDKLGTLVFSGKNPPAVPVPSTLLRDTLELPRSGRFTSTRIRRLWLLAAAPICHTPIFLRGTHTVQYQTT